MITRTFLAIPNHPEQYPIVMGKIHTLKIIHRSEDNMNCTCPRINHDKSALSLNFLLLYTLTSNKLRQLHETISKRTEVHACLSMRLNGLVRHMSFHRSFQLWKTIIKTFIAVIVSPEIHYPEISIFFIWP